MLKSLDINTWRNIPGFKRHYQANFHGQIRRVYKTTTKVLSQYQKTNDKKYFCKMDLKDVQASKAVWMAFNGSIPNGMCVIHKNGMKSDNCINNLQLVSKRELGLIFGMQSKSKCVVKLDEFGEVVEFYKSARECGRQNYMSYQTIMDRYNGKVKSAFAPDGYAYAWEDSEVSMRRAIEKIEKSTIFMPKAR